LYISPATGLTNMQRGSRIFQGLLLGTKIRFTAQVRFHFKSFALPIKILKSQFRDGSMGASGVISFL